MGGTTSTSNSSGDKTFQDIIRLGIPTPVEFLFRDEDLCFCYTYYGGERAFKLENNATLCMNDAQYTIRYIMIYPGFIQLVDYDDVVFSFPVKVGDDENNDALSDLFFMDGITNLSKIFTPITEAVVIVEDENPKYIAIDSPVYMSKAQQRLLNNKRFMNPVFDVITTPYQSLGDLKIQATYEKYGQWSLSSEPIAEASEKTTLINPSTKKKETRTIKNQLTPIKLVVLPNMYMVTMSEGTIFAYPLKIDETDTSFFVASDFTVMSTVLCPLPEFQDRPAIDTLYYFNIPHSITVNKLKDISGGIYFKRIQNVRDYHRPQKTDENLKIYLKHQNK